MTNSQVPKSQINPNNQAPNPIGAVSIGRSLLGFGHWSLGFIWDLGTWSLGICHAVPFNRKLLFLISSFIILTYAFPAQANPTQEEVFKSIQNNVNDQIDGRHV